MKKDKQKVVDEVWTEDRIKAFLTVQPADAVTADFHRLLKAYQSMRVEDFTVFVELFVAAKGCINAVNPRGETVLSILKQHRHAEPYRAILQAYGAAEG